MLPVELLSSLTFKCLGCSNLSKALKILPLGIISFTLLSNTFQGTADRNIDHKKWFSSDSYKCFQFPFPGMGMGWGEGVGRRRSGQWVQAGLVSLSGSWGSLESWTLGVFLENLLCKLPALLPFPFAAHWKGPCCGGSSRSCGSACGGTQCSAGSAVCFANEGIGIKCCSSICLKEKCVTSLPCLLRIRNDGEAVAFTDPSHESIWLLYLPFFFFSF